MPAQGLGRCDYRSRLLRTRAVRIAMPAQGLGRCDTRIYEKGGHVPDHRNARAGAWTLRQPDVRIRAPRIVASQCPRRGLDAATRPHAHRRPSSRHRNARAGAWTLRLRKSHRGSQEGPRRYRNARAGAWTLRQHVPEDGEPAVRGSQCPRRGLDAATGRHDADGQCGHRYRNARAGAWTLRREHAVPHAKVGRRSQCPRRGLDAATARIWRIRPTSLGLDMTRDDEKEIRAKEREGVDVQT